MAINLNQLLASLCWGGMGAVVGAFFAIWKHVAVDQDVDSQYAMWYLTHPLMGVALGGFVLCSWSIKLVFYPSPLAAAEVKPSSQRWTFT